jgi:acyl carrier protein
MMDREALREELKAIFEDDTGKSIETLSDSIEMRDGLGLDSLDLVSLVMQIEQRFRIRLAHEELANVTTAGQMIDLIHEKIRAAESSAPAQTPSHRKAA